MSASTESQWPLDDSGFWPSSRATPHRAVISVVSAKTWTPTLRATPEDHRRGGRPVGEDRAEPRESALRADDLTSRVWKTVRIYTYFAPNGNSSMFPRFGSRLEPEGRGFQPRGSVSAASRRDQPTPTSERILDSGAE
jgi:hypothetical protein